MSDDPKHRLIAGPFSLEIAPGAYSKWSAGEPSPLADLVRLHNEMARDSVLRQLLRLDKQMTSVTWEVPPYRSRDAIERRTSTVRWRAELRQRMRRADWACPVGLP